MKKCGLYIANGLRTGVTKHQEAQVAGGNLRADLQKHHSMDFFHSTYGGVKVESDLGTKANYTRSILCGKQEDVTTIKKKAIKPHRQKIES